jgi:hypothetical protein
MPNGGPDCCGNCFHNPNGGVCTLRDVIIADKMWTYCANYTHSKIIDAEAKGPIFSTGLYEGYVRLPWLGDRRPKAKKPVKCYDCGDFVDNGIEIELRSGEKYGFCCNQNYFNWWSSHPETDEEWIPSQEDLKTYDVCPKEQGKPVNPFKVK